MAKNRITKKRNTKPYYPQQVRVYANGTSIASASPLPQELEPTRENLQNRKSFDQGWEYLDLRVSGRPYKTFEGADRQPTKVWGDLVLSSMWVSDLMIGEEEEDGTANTIFDVYKDENYTIKKPRYKPPYVDDLEQKYLHAKHYEALALIPVVLDYQPFRVVAYGYDEVRRWRPKTSNPNIPYRGFGLLQGSVEHSMQEVIR